MKKGKLLELIITSLEKSLNKFPYLEIRHNQFLFDKDGNQRQIDVLIEANFGERLGTPKIIFECKDLNKKIGLNTVSAFIELINSLNCQKGFIVSRNGFTKPAQKKALGTKDKVSLLKLSEVENFEFSKYFENNAFFIDHLIDFDNVKFELILEGKVANDVPPGELVKNAFYDSDFKLVTENFFDYFFDKAKQKKEIIKNLIKSKKIEFAKSLEKNVEAEIKINIENIQGHINYGGFIWFPVKSFNIILPIKIFKSTNKTVEQFNYEDITKGLMISDLKKFEFESHFLLVIENSTNNSESKFFVIMKNDNSGPKEIFSLGEL